jgi:hypothetical protein
MGVSPTVANLLLAIDSVSVTGRTSKAVEKRERRSMKEEE